MNARARVAKAVLVCSILALIATSSPGEWHVEDKASEEYWFAAGEGAQQTAVATVAYRTPRGTWPLTISYFDNGTPPTQVALSDSAELDARTRFSTATESAHAFQIVCEQELCEGSLELDLHLAWTSALPQSRDAGTVRLADGGLGPAQPGAVTLRASFVGGPDKPFWGCDGKDSSTDSDDAPKQLGVQVSINPFLADPAASTVPGAPASDASVEPPMMRPRGLDAGT